MANSVTVGPWRVCCRCGIDMDARDSWVHILRPIVISDAAPDGADLVVTGSVETTVRLFGAACIDDDHDWAHLKMTCGVGRAAVQALRWMRSAELSRQRNIESDNLGWWVTWGDVDYDHDANSEEQVHTLAWGDLEDWHGLNSAAYCSL
jgi:hypothetical protein